MEVLNVDAINGLRDSGGEMAVATCGNCVDNILDGGNNVEERGNSSEGIEAFLSSVANLS